MTPSRRPPRDAEEKATCPYSLYGVIQPEVKKLIGFAVFGEQTGARQQTATTGFPNPIRKNGIACMYAIPIIGVDPRRPRHSRAFLHGQPSTD